MRKLVSNGALPSAFRDRARQRRNPTPLLIVLSALLLGTAAVSVSTASTAAACSSGEICYWGEDRYTGCYYATQNDDSNLANNYWFNCYPASVNQGVNSAANVANYCDIRFYDWSSYRGGSHWMGRVNVHSYWYDVNFGNNYWFNGSGTVENDITSHNFCP